MVFKMRPENTNISISEKTGKIPWYKIYIFLLGLTCFPNMEKGVVKKREKKMSFSIRGIACAMHVFLIVVSSKFLAYNLY